MKKVSFFKWFKKYLKREYRRLKELHRLEMDNPTVTIEKGVRIKNSSRLSLGKHIYICDGTLLDCGGGEWCNDSGRITIGDNVYIGNDSILLGAGEIEIQSGCVTGANVLITSHTPDPSKIKIGEHISDGPILPHKFKKVTIEEGTMIGPYSIILLGVTIGRNAIISAGSIIRLDVAPKSMIFPDVKLKDVNFSGAKNSVTNFG